LPEITASSGEDAADTLTQKADEKVPDKAPTPDAKLNEYHDISLCKN
jgi:hypothetical protein